MKLKSNFVAVENPYYKEDSQKKIVLSAEAEETILAERVMKLTKLTVFAVGKECTETLAGEIVFIDVSRILRAPMVIVEDSAYWIIREPDLMLEY